MDRRWRADVIPAPNCPRCASSNTKFCYYNNYSLSQPRFFCKGCKRYWTKGGSLRSIPVGGGCRKRRSRSTKVSSSSPNSSSDCSEKSVGPDIDMAAVFAKFLNHDQGNFRREINGAANTTSFEGSHDSLTSRSYGLENGFESQLFSDDIVVPDHNQLQEEGAVQGFMNLDLASFDDIIEDVFWSDDSNISSLTWHQYLSQRNLIQHCYQYTSMMSQLIVSPLITGVASITQNLKHSLDLGSFHKLVESGNTLASDTFSSSNQV